MLFSIHTCNIQFYVGAPQTARIQTVFKFYKTGQFETCYFLARYFSLDNYFLNYRILKVRDLYNLEVAKFMHGHHKNMLPTCFADFFQERSETHSYNTRSSSQRNYSLVACRSTQGQRSIRFYGPKIWNSIPTSSRDLSKYKFKKYYKDFVLSKY